jgi:AcrR family transcriptional regulator
VAEPVSRATYQHQSGIHRRTRGAILEATQSLVLDFGLHHTNMIDIADRAQVSRASLYNHFRDKNEVFVALLGVEIDRIAVLAKVSGSRAESLYFISKEISTHGALRSALEHDPAAVAIALSSREHELWVRIYRHLAEIFASDAVGVGMIVRWLLGQVTAPLSNEHSKLQADRLIRALS